MATTQTILVDQRIGKLRHENRGEDGNLVDATSVLLSDAAAAFGIKRGDTGAVVVADATAFTKVATGTYEYTFTPPALGVDYVAALEVTQTNGNVHREEFTVRIPQVLGPDDPYVGEADLRTDIPWVDDLLHRAHGQSGFLEQRRLARRWFDQAILEMAPATWNWFEGTGDYAAWEEDLAAGELAVNLSVRQANRDRALYEVFKSNVREPGDKYDLLASRYREDAEQRLTQVRTTLAGRTIDLRSTRLVPA